MGSKNEPTEFIYIERTTSGEYAVSIPRPRTTYYKTGFKSLMDAIKARDEILKNMKKLDDGRQGETYETLIELGKQCIRCSRPHLPGSEYCAFHKKRAEK